jgi:predicted aspartyl protease
VYHLGADSHHTCTITSCTIHSILDPSLHSKLLVFDLLTDHGIAKVLLDCGSTTNFISKRYVSKHRIAAASIANSQVVKLADGSVHHTCKLVQHYILNINNRKLKEHLLVLPLDNFDIILGMPWLKKHNPTIDWQTNTLTLPPTQLQQLLTQCHDHNSSSSSVPPPPPPSKAAATLAATNSVRAPSSSLSPGTIPNQVPSIEICHISSKQVRKDIKKGDQYYLLFVRAKRDYSTGPPSTIELNLAESVHQDANIKPSDAPIISKLVNEYCDVFPDDLPKGLPPERFIEHHIKLEPGSQPTFRNYNRLSPQDLDELKVHLKDLLDHGFIRAAHSPYGAPVLFAKKAGEVKRRLCIDYRDLNRITIKDKYPLPRVDELLDRLLGAKYFTKLDLRSGYHQVRVAQEDIQKTAFNTRYGQYEYLVVPFGLTGAPSTFMHIINHMLNPYLDKFAVAYLDDILIYSKTVEEHEEHVRIILELLRKNKLYCKESKCEFFRNLVKFLGFIITDQGIQVDQAKVEAAKVWPVPKSVTEVRSFLGFVGFYRRFIANHSQVVAPMSDLTKKPEKLGTPFAWTPEAQVSFEKMVKALCDAPILIHPDPSKPYVITTDASGFALGACLSQDHGNGLQPIAYMSKKMLEAETRYAIHEKEMLAIICALKEWRHYLHGCPFSVVVYTDHKSLVHFSTQPKLSERQARWNEFLAEFQPFKIIYQEGSKNVVADALSRRSDHTTKESTAVDAPAAAALNVLSSVSNGVMDEIKAGYATDEFCKHALADIKTTKSNHYTISNDVIVYDKQRVLVPDVLALKTKLLSEHHDGMLAGHIGLEKTYECLSRNYYWPGMYRDTKKYVHTCMECQRIKSSNQKKAGLLQPLPIPKARWDQVTMDFIVQLPKTKAGHDAIYVIVDKLSKMAHFIPTHTTATAPDTAKLFLHHVVKLHGVPKSIVSDRDSKFTSQFWKSLWQLLDTKLAMSTAFHPQTDGQTEVMNKMLEQMLRAFTNVKQDNWDELLPYCEIAYNNSKNVTTGYSPFYLNHGQEINLPSNISVTDELANVAVEELLTKLNESLTLAELNIKEAQEHQKKYADKNRREVTFKVDDKVLLDARDITFTAGSKKLLDKYLGPYPITEVISATAYRLKLPPKFRIHDVFHVSKLKEAKETDTFPDRVQVNRPDPIVQLDGEDAWYVEEIVGKKTMKGKVYYQVKWESFPEWENTWEPKTNLMKYAPDIIQYYENSNSTGEPT